MTRVLDVIGAALVLALGGLAILAQALPLRLTRRRGPRRIVYLGTGQIAQVFPRNGVNLFLERECSDFDGYFEQMWNVHFPAAARGEMSLTPRHHLVDVDFALPRGVEPYRRLAMALREVAFLLWLSRFVWCVRGSIVTATNPYLQGLNAALLSRLIGIPYAVIITRDFDWDWDVLGKQAFGSVFPSRRVERAIGRWVLRHAHLVLADRRYYRDFAVRNGARPERAVATRVLADNAYARARASNTTREQFGLSPAPLLMYVGRLDADKFALDLVACLASVRQRVPNAQLACAGTGALTSEMQQRAHALGIGDGLHLLGAVDLSLLPDLIASADVVVAPHMGYTLIEAGLTGVPIVTYDYDFHSEIVEDGVSGLLVPFRDTEALAAAVLRVLDDPAFGRALGERLRAHLLEEHSLAAVVPLYRTAYDRALVAA